MTPPDEPIKRYLSCPCGVTSMLSPPPSPDARFLGSTYRCPVCDGTIQAVPTAWDQP